MRRRGNAPSATENPWLCEQGAAHCAARMEKRGRLLRSADGEELFSVRKRPQRETSLRGAGATYAITTGSKGAGDLVTDALTIGPRGRAPGLQGKPIPAPCIYTRGDPSWFGNWISPRARCAPRRKKVDYFTRPPRE